MAIDTQKEFCDAINFIGGIKKIGDFDTVIQIMQNSARRRGASAGGINNATGAWYAWLLAIEAIKFKGRNPNACTLVKLPAIDQFDYTTLYKAEQTELIQDFKEKIGQQANVNLISSNPDYAIISADISVPAINLAVPLTKSSLNQIDNDYKNFISKCGLNDIKGYLGAKKSLRPDRRLQLLHEGSLVKAVYTHLQTRQWLTDANRIKFYAASGKVSEADRQGLRSVATHSITSALVQPEPAVDAVEVISSAVQAQRVFRKFLI